MEEKRQSKRPSESLVEFMCMVRHKEPKTKDSNGIIKFLQAPSYGGWLLTEPVYRQPDLRSTGELSGRYLLVGVRPSTLYVTQRRPRTFLRLKIDQVTS